MGISARLTMKTTGIEKNVVNIGYQINDLLRRNLYQFTDTLE